MADEQIKIRIQADAEQFKIVSAAVEKALAGIGKQADITRDKMKQTGDSVKKSNQQWTNLALILQDLPYGFRGIQNNLPALVGSVAGATGAIYLAFSGIIALVTAYEKEIVQLIYGIDDLGRAHQAMNKAIAENVGQAKAQIASDQALLSIVTDVTKSTKERERALTELKSRYEGNIALQKTDINDGAQLVKIIDDISAALIRKAKAQAFSELIAKEEAEILKLQSQNGKEVVKNLGFMKTTLALVKGGMSGFGAATALTTDAFTDQASKIGDAQSRLKLYNTALKANTAEQIKNNDAANISDTKPGKPKKDNTQKEIDKELERQKKAELYRQQMESKFLADSQRALDQAAAEKRKLEIEGYNQNITDFKTFYANKLQLAAGDRDAQKAILEQQMQDLVYFYQTFGMYAGDVGDIFSDVYKKWVDNNKAITEEAYKSILQIGNGIMNMLGPSLDMLLEKGATLGEVLTNAFQSIIKQLLKVIATALIAAALMAIIFPGKLAAAGGFGKVFGGLVGQGMGLGGLIGGSNAGATATNSAQGVSNNFLPNTASNSGGGLFTLRGQDLVLAMNRSESSLKLRRG
jgi:hypothetical protein